MPQLREIFVISSITCTLIVGRETANLLFTHKSQTRHFVAIIAAFLAYHNPLKGPICLYDCQITGQFAADAQL